MNESRLKKVYRLISTEQVGRFLDVGCSSGTFAKPLISRGWRVSGLDLDPGQVEAACKNGLDARVQDITTGFPFEDETFDCVFAGEVIEHLVDTDFFVKEMYRVTRAGGSVILTTPNLASFENRVRLLFGIYPIWVNYNLEGVGHVRAYTPKILKKQLSECGFRVEKHTGNWVPFIPQKFVDDVKYPFLAITGDLLPSLSMDIIMKARKPGSYSDNVGTF